MHRKSLQQAIKDEDYTKCMDILQSIEKLQMTSDLIKESKLGNIVASLFRAANADLSSKAKDIIATWKKIIEPRTISRNSNVDISKSVDIEHKHQETTSNPSSESTADLMKVFASQESNESTKQENNEIDSSKPIVLTSKRNPQRLKVLNALIEAISSSKSKTIKLHESVAISIELAVYKQFPIESNIKKYLSKCRSLAYNLKRNPVLLRNILSNEITVDDLVNMTVNELATNEVVNKRMDVSEKQLDEKRGDWYEAHRLQVLESIGVDPSNVWTYDQDEDTGSEPDVAGD